MSDQAWRSIEQLIATWNNQASLLEQSALRQRGSSRSPYTLAHPDETAARELRNCARQLQACVVAAVPLDPEVLKPERWYEVYDWCRDIQKLAQQVSVRVDEFANAIPDPPLVGGQK